MTRIVQIIDSKLIILIFFQEELEAWKEDGLLDLHVAFSRDQDQKRYVTHILRETGDKVWDLLQQVLNSYL